MIQDQKGIGNMMNIILHIRRILSGNAWRSPSVLVPPLLLTEQN